MNLSQIARYQGMPQRGEVSKRGKRPTATRPPIVCSSKTRLDSRTPWAYRAISRNWVVWMKLAPRVQDPHTAASSGPDEWSPPRDLPHLHPHELEPALRLVRRRQKFAYGTHTHRSQPRAWPILLILPVLVLVLIAANILQGTLSHPNGLDRLLEDIGQLSRLTLQTEAEAYFPLTRDSLTFAVILLLTINIAVAHRQWFLIERLIPTLVAYKTICFRGDDADVFRQAIDRANRRLINPLPRADSATGRTAWALVRLSIPLMLALLLVSAQRESGVFYRLALPGVDGWTHEAYAGWWAGWDGHLLGPLIYLGLAWLFAYYILVQNYVGVTVLWLFVSQRDRIRFRLNIHNPDGHYGWDLVRRLLRTVFLSGLGNAFALLLLFNIVPLNTWLWASIWAFFLLVLGPAYILVPVAFLNRDLKAHKDQLRAEVVRRLASRRPSSELAERDAGSALQLEHLVHEEVTYIDQIPTMPFRVRQLGLATAIYAIPVATLGVQVYQLLAVAE